MLQYQIKLRITRTQDKTLNDWLFRLTGVWNWAVKKIESSMDGNPHWRKSEYDFMSMVKGHGERVGIPSHCLRGVVDTAYKAWDRCFTKAAKKPRLKGNRRKLASISFPDPIKLHPGHRVAIPGLGRVRYHKQGVPNGKIKCGRIVKKASGWYLCLFIDCFRKEIEPRVERKSVGIDPGFKHLLTLSTGEKVQHPRELEAGAKRLAQTQRGKNKKLAARQHERIANQKKDRNHKLSLSLVQRFNQIYFSKDNIKGLRNGLFGKSVTSSNHYQLRQTIKYKSLAGGTSYHEVESKFSTQDCSTCGSRQGPRGLGGLKVRTWVCSGCGTTLDRDVNAAINTLKAGAGQALETHTCAVRKL